MLITGDDILIEYVDRLCEVLKPISESSLRKEWGMTIEAFITHYVWHSQDAV